MHAALVPLPVNTSVLCLQSLSVPASHCSQAERVSSRGGDETHREDRHPGGSGCHGERKQAPPSATTSGATLSNKPRRPELRHKSICKKQRQQMEAVSQEKQRRA